MPRYHPGRIVLQAPLRRPQSIGVQLSKYVAVSLIAGAYVPLFR